MTLKRYLFEGATDGTVASTANTEATLVFPGTGSIVFDSSRGRNGNGLAFLSQPGQQTEARFAATAQNTTMAIRGWFYGPGSTPSQTTTLMNIRHSGGVVARIQWSATNQLLAEPTSGSTLTIATDLNPGLQYDLSIRAIVGTSFDVVLRSVSGTTVGTLSSTTIDLGANPINSVAVGIIGNYATSYDSGWDEISLNDGASNEIALYSPPATSGSAFDLVWTGNSWE